MDQDDLIIFQLMATMASTTNDLFNSHEMEEEKGRYVNSTTGVQDVLDMMWTTQTQLFKTLMSFTLAEFDKLPSQVVLAIKAHARSIGELFLSNFMFSILIF